jgi:hypothetical protein
MKIMKSLSLTLLFTASYACAMERHPKTSPVSPAAIINDVQDMDKNGTGEKARLMVAVNAMHDRDSLYLHTAVVARANNALKLFLDAGAPIRTDQHGKTPMDHAFEQKNYDAAGILAQYPNAQTYSLKTIIDRNDHESLQQIINNKWLHIPDASDLAFEVKTGNCTSPELDLSVKELDQTLSLASASVITMPEALYQTLCVRVCNYNRIAFLFCNADERDYVARQLALINFVTKHAAFLKANSDYAWRTYAVALAKEAPSDDGVLKALQKNVPINPLNEWRSIQLPQSKNPENPVNLLAKIYTILKLQPQISLDEQTANTIDDIANTSNYPIRYSLRNLLYDYTSADRHIFRPVNPFYWYRQCTKGKPVDDDATSSASTSSTQSGQADPANDDKKDK